MLSPKVLGSDRNQHGLRSLHAGGEAMACGTSPASAKSSLAAAAKPISSYSVLQQHPGFHQFKLERPPPASFERLQATRDSSKDEKSSVDDSQILEHALAMMRREQEFYADKESNLHYHRTSSSERSCPTKPENFQPIPHKYRVSRDAKRPALAATHPALYSGPPPGKAKVYLPPPSLPHRRATDHTNRMPEHEVEPDKSVPPWRVCTDPKRLTSAVPMFNDPRYRMLKMDVMPDQPSVVSPSFMIALPFGTLIEGACPYVDERQ